MSNVKSFFQNLTVKEPEKSFIKAGLMDENLEYSQEVKDEALRQVIEEKIATKEFQDTLKALAKETLDAEKK